MNTISNLPADARDTLNRVMNDTGIELSERQQEQFLSYYSMLIERNRVMNLTAITDFREVLIKHFADSLAPATIGAAAGIFTNPGTKILDLGTGAGFPGMPLAIALPDIRFTLADSLQKRTHFLEEVVEELGLENVCVISGRAEDLGKSDDYRATFDVVVSRAVADYRVLCEYCLPFVKENGVFAAWKGPAAPEEIKNAENAVHILGGNEPRILHYQLPEINEERNIILTEKVRPTPEKYPRRAGIPTKRPL